MEFVSSEFFIFVLGEQEDAAAADNDKEDTTVEAPDPAKTACGKRE